MNALCYYWTMACSNVKSYSPTCFLHLEAMQRVGITVVESDYVGIAPAKSTLHGKALAYAYTRASSESFSIRVFRLDTNDDNPVNVDLYSLTLVGSAARLIGPTKPSSGHHLDDLPSTVWAGLPPRSAGPFHFPVNPSTSLISSSTNLYSS